MASVSGLVFIAVYSFGHPMKYYSNVRCLVYPLVR